MKLQSDSFRNPILGAQHFTLAAKPKHKIFEVPSSVYSFYLLYFSSLEGVGRGL